MTGVAVVAVLLCVPAGVFFGVWLGRTWGSLPSLRPGAAVDFRGVEVGLVRRLFVQEITHEITGTTVTLRSES